MAPCSQLSMLTEIYQLLAEIGHVLANFGQHVARFGQGWSDLSKVVRNVAECGNTLAKFGQRWSKFVGVWENLATLVRKWPRSARIGVALPRQLLDNGSATLGQLRGTPGSSEVTFRDAQQATVWQRSDNLIVSAMTGRCKAADITRLPELPPRHAQGGAVFERPGPGRASA